MLPTSSKFVVEISSKPQTSTCENTSVLIFLIKYLFHLDLAPVKSIFL